MNLTAMASFIGTSNYLIAKQGCYRCGRNDRLVDTSTHIEGEGFLALCTGCLTDLARAAGVDFSGSYVQELEARLAESEAARLVAEHSRDQVFEALREAASDAPKPKSRPRNRSAA